MISSLFDFFNNKFSIISSIFLYSYDFSLIILFFDKFFFLTYIEINEPMIFRAII
jgi:hypothetical protein